MRSTKRVLVIVTALAAMVPMGATATGESSTPLRDGICQNGEFCIYLDANREGAVMDWNRAGDDNAYSNNTWPRAGGNVNDEASSYWNRTSCAVRVHRDSNQNGDGETFAPGERQNFSDTAVGNDRASSHNACV